MTAPAATKTLTLRPRDVEREYGIAEKCLANWRSAGKGPAFSRLSSKMVLYSRADLDAWLTANRVDPGGE